MKSLRAIHRQRVWLGLLLVVIGLGTSGCATTESENMSSRPWNSPEGWQNGSLPGMTQPR